MSEQANLLRMLASDHFRGIGERTAKKLVDHFGVGLYDVLDREDKKALTGVLSPSKLESVLQGWRIVSDQKELVRWLDDQGIDSKIGVTIYRVWGKDSIGKLASNPYRLLAFLSWDAVDRLAKALGVAADHPVRLVGAAEAAGYAWINKHGSTWVGREALLGDISSLLSTRTQRFHFGKLAGEAIAKAVETGALIEVGEGYQVPGAYYIEREIEEWVRQRLDVEASPERMPEMPISSSEGKNIHLTSEQRMAVLNALQSRLSVFHGGAGVGKTTVVRTICDLVEQRGKHPVLLAIAAKAVRKLSAATGREAMTLARAFFHLHPWNLENVVVVIDEASMVDILDFRRLIRKLPSSAHLVLCGDAAQLPSIGPGKLLHSLIQSGTVPVQELTVTHRQAAATGIPAKLREVRAGRVPTLPRYDWENPCAEGLFDLGCAGKDPRPIQRLVARLVAVYKGEAQVITPFSSDRYALGCQALNAHIHQHITGQDNYTEGTPVVFTANQRLAAGVEIVNGLQGVVRRVVIERPKHGDELHLEVEVAGTVTPLRFAETEAWLEFAYALTVHRAQGSDWQTVIAVLPPSQLLERSMVYTALSRCKRRCILLAPDPVALAEAVAAPPIYERRQDRLFVKT